VTDTVTGTARAFAGLKRYVDSRLAARTQYRNCHAAVLVSGSTEVPSRMRDRKYCWMKLNRVVHTGFTMTN
jgi:hypothetical protein